MSKDVDKKSTIIEIAIRLFSKYGYAKTSVDEIASQANIAKGTVYYYFTSKEELFMEAISSKSQEFFAALHEQIAQTQGFEAQLKAYISLPMKYAYENMPILLEGLKSIPFSYISRIDEYRKVSQARMLLILRQILECGLAEGKVTEAISIDRICEMIHDWFMPGNLRFEVSDIEQMLKRIEKDHEALVNLILYGIIRRG